MLSTLPGGRLQATAAQEEQLIQGPADELESEESSGEYETDSEDDTRQLLKPTFTHARQGWGPLIQPTAFLRLAVHFDHVMHFIPKAGAKWCCSRRAIAPCRGQVCATAGLHVHVACSMCDTTGSQPTAATIHQGKPWPAV